MSIMAISYKLSALQQVELIIGHYFLEVYDSVLTQVLLTLSHGLKALPIMN